MAASHFETRFPHKDFSPHRTSTVFAVPTPQVGIAALRRPQRRAQRQAPEIESQGACLIPMRSALPGGGIAARCPLPAWMAVSHFETRFPHKDFPRYRTSTGVSRPNAPGRDRRAAASPGAERSVRRRKTNRTASVFFPFVPPSRAGASQRDALYLLGWRHLILKPVSRIKIFHRTALQPS